MSSIDDYKTATPPEYSEDGERPTDDGQHEGELDAKACAWMAFCKGLATMGNRDAGEHKAVFESWWQCYGAIDAATLIAARTERDALRAEVERVKAERDADRVQASYATANEIAAYFDQIQILADNNGNHDVRWMSWAAQRIRTRFSHAWKPAASGEGSK